MDAPTDFGIKPGYTPNLTPRYFVDDVTSARGTIFQPDVYTFAEWVAERTTVWAIVDIGCGWGDKLAGIHERHPYWDLLGLDYGVNIEHCHKAHPWGRWREQNLEESFALDALGTVIVCADVIEHLIDPRPLIATLKDSRATAIVLSTPERDLEHGLDHMGPSPNECHVREWNGVELRAFLEGEGLTVRHVGLTRGNDSGSAMATQLVVCEP